MGDGPGVAELGFRLVGSLALVVGLLFLIARLVNRRMRPTQGAAVQVVARQQLTRAAGVAVVTVGGRVLVVGTTEHQVSLLAEMEPEDLADGLGEDLGGDLDEDLDEELVALVGRAGAVPPRAGTPRPPDARAAGPLSGSVLSPQTWRQTLAFFSGGTAGRPERTAQRPEGTAQRPDPPGAHRAVS